MPSLRLPRCAFLSPAFVAIAALRLSSAKDSESSAPALSDSQPWIARRPCSLNDEEQAVYELWRHRTELLESGALADMINAEEYTAVSLGQELSEHFVDAAHQRHAHGVLSFQALIKDAERAVKDQDAFDYAATDWLRAVNDHVCDALAEVPAFKEIEDMVGEWAAGFADAATQAGQFGFYNASFAVLAGIDGSASKDETAISLFVRALETAAQEFAGKQKTRKNAHPLLRAYHHTTQLIGSVPSSRDHFNAYVGQYQAHGHGFQYTITTVDSVKQEAETSFTEKLMAVCNAPGGTDPDTFTMSIVMMNTGRAGEGCVSAQSMGGLLGTWDLLPSMEKQSCNHGRNCRAEWEYECGDSLVTVTYEYDAWWGHHNENRFLTIADAPDFVQRDIAEYCSAVNFIQTSCEFEASDGCHVCVVKDTPHEHTAHERPEKAADVTAHSQARKFPSASAGLERSPSKIPLGKPVNTIRVVS